MKLNELEGDVTVLSMDVDEIRGKDAMNIGDLVGDPLFGEREVVEVFIYPSKINIYVRGKEKTK